MNQTKQSFQNDDAITYNQRMSLNGMAQLNVNENGLSEKDSFDSNVYHVYVAGEGGRQKTPHFHIRHKSEGWDIRMNMDGSFHSIKTNSSERQNSKDFADIEEISKNWVLKLCTLDDKLTNREFGDILWIAMNS
jgi:hypothetical protein